MTFAVEHVAAPTEDARLLVTELESELSTLFTAEQRHGLSLERVFQPGIKFFIGYLEGAPVGCGGIAFETDFAELKRMYVRPSFRGCGVAEKILARLEQEALAHGMRRVALETGDVLQAAIRLYERAGYVECTSFGAYSAMPPASIVRSRFYEKHLG